VPADDAPVVRLDLTRQVVVDALVASYPSWTDENGTNVEQLAEVAIAALASAGLLCEPPSA
jgi:hypothetical protein